MKFEGTNLVGHEVNFEAPQHVRKAIASLGRTEDVRFSPNNRLLAIADHLRDKIVIFEVSIDPSRNSKNVSLNSALEISSQYLRRPHGVDFIDDKRLIVANRDGQACIFEIPPGAMGDCELQPLAVLNSEDVSSPGSVAVSKNDQGVYEALICNDFTNQVTRHWLEFDDKCSFKGGAPLLKKWIQFPDGVCVSKEKRWIALSNHDTNAVFLYRNEASLNTSSTPDGILRHYYPHGLRFASDDRFILVASAGSPFVNIYEASDSDWRGVRHPVLTIKVLSDEDYLRCRKTREDGGPKGIDINKDTNLLVVTCENKPLAFFDLTSILDSARVKSGLVPSKNGYGALELKYQLYSGKIRAGCTAGVRWALCKIPTLSRLLNKGRKIWNSRYLTRPF